ncbi:hypothetical protein OAF64_06550 [Crocinitomicaceae bacterium]|nr:hypothetical protein [Crocinitomicaceae bacterium]
MNLFKLSIITCSVAILSYSFNTNNNMSTEKNDGVTNIAFQNNKTERVSLKLKGTGSKRITVKVGVGTSVGNCARGCYKTIGPNTTVSIQANVGDVIWDADRKTTILKVSSGMNGDVIDLKNYY